jgi:RNase P subunit RPR2
MFNPLTENVRTLKDTELENKIQELGRKYHIAARTMGGGVLIQIATLLEEYKTELSRRQLESMKELAKKSDKNLEGLIKRD